MRNLMTIGAAVAIVFGLAVATPAAAQPCSGLFATDSDDLVKIKGKLYDPAGNETKVSCKLADATGAFAADSDCVPSPCRYFLIVCPELTPLIPGPDFTPQFRAFGTEMQIIKNGKPKNACIFKGNVDSLVSFQYGGSTSSIQKRDSAGNFRSEKGTLSFNTSDGSIFVGKFKVVAK